jgi:Lipocalin-like domain
MKRRALLKMAAVSPLAGAVAANAHTRTLREQLIGAWRMVDAETVDIATGASAPLSGKRGPYSGLIVYLANGLMSVQFAAQRNVVRVSASRGQLTADEKSAYFDTYFGYFGKFEVDEQERLVRHQPEGSILESQVGRTLVRLIKIDGDLLTLTTEDRRKTATGLTFDRLTWRRA